MGFLSKTINFFCSRTIIVFPGLIIVLVGSFYQTAFAQTQISQVKNPPQVFFLGNKKEHNITIPMLNSGIELEWQSWLADVCFFEDNGQNKPIALNGDLMVEPISAPRTYVVSCSNTSGVTKQAFTVNILSPSSGPVVTTHLDINGSTDAITVSKDKAVEISWSAVNAETCLAINRENYWSGEQLIVGKVTISRMATSSVFVLTCFNQNGSHEVSIVVNVDTLHQEHPTPAASSSSSSSSPTTLMPISSTGPSSVSLSQTSFSLTGPFEVGGRGSQVTLLQTLLARDARFYPEGILSGWYGPLTVRAVQRFQAQYGILTKGSPETTGYGLAGPLTRRKIIEVFGDTTTTPDTTLILPLPAFSQRPPSNIEGQQLQQIQSLLQQLQQLQAQLDALRGR